MKKLFSLLFLFPSLLFAQGNFVRIDVITHEVTYPTNFWDVNAALILAAIGGGGGTNFISSVSSDFEVSSGLLSVTNTLGTGPLLRQSAGASGTGTVTNVGFSASAEFSVGGQPVTTGGTITLLLTDIELLALAGLTSAADRVPYFTGSGSASLATFTSFGRTLAALADAAAGRTTLSLVPGTDIQAYDSDLTRLGGIGSGTIGDLLYRDATGWTNLARGADGQFLAATATTLAWSNAPSGGGGGDVYLANNQVFTGTNTFNTNVVFVSSVTAPTTTALASNTVVATTAYVDRAAASVPTTLCWQTVIAMSPSDSTTYYPGISNFRTTESEGQMRVPITGKVIGYTVRLVTTGTLATSETVNYYLRTSSTDFGNTTVGWNAGYAVTHVGSLSQSVTAGDLIALKVVSPAWATNPIGVYIHVTVLFIP